RRASRRAFARLPSRRSSWLQLFSLSPIPLHAFAGQPAGLLHPRGELRFVDLFAFMDIEIAHILLFGRARRERVQRCAAEECHFDVLRKAMKAEEPTLVLAFDAIER